MSFTNKEAHDFLLEHTSHFSKNAPRTQKCAEAATKFIAHTGADDYKGIHRKFERLLKPGNKASPDDVDTWEKKVFYEAQPPPLDEKPKGRPSKTLGDEPCVKRQRTILKKVLEDTVRTIC